MSKLAGSVFDKNTPGIVRISRVAMATVLGLVLVIHGMILAI